MAGKQGINGRQLARLGNDLGSPTFLLRYESTSTAGTSVTESILENAPFKFQVVDAYFVLTEAPTGTNDSVKLTDGTNDITDTVNYASSGDTDIVRFGELDDAHWVINKGEDLKLVKTESAAVSSLVMFVVCARV